MVTSEELIGTVKYLTQQTWCHINWCSYNHVWLYLGMWVRHCTLPITLMSFFRFKPLTLEGQLKLWFKYNCGGVKYLTQQTWCHINWCSYNHVWLYLGMWVHHCTLPITVMSLFRFKPLTLEGQLKLWFKYNCGGYLNDSSQLLLYLIQIESLTEVIPESPKKLPSRQLSRGLLHEDTSDLET